MITRQEVRQMVSDQVSRYDFSCYPMSCNTFIEDMSYNLFQICRRNKLELEDITQEIWDNAESSYLQIYDSEE